MPNQNSVQRNLLSKIEEAQLERIKGAIQRIKMVACQVGYTEYDATFMICQQLSCVSKHELASKHQKDSRIFDKVSQKILRKCLKLPLAMKIILNELEGLQNKLQKENEAEVSSCRSGTQRSVSSESEEDKQSTKKQPQDLSGTGEKSVQEIKKEMMEMYREKFLKERGRRNPF